jgi:hypothetical protein
MHGHMNVTMHGHMNVKNPRLGYVACVVDEVGQGQVFLRVFAASLSVLPHQCSVMLQRLGFGVSSSTVVKQAT